MNEIYKIYWLYSCQWQKMFWHKSLSGVGKIAREFPVSTARKIFTDRPQISLITLNRQ